MLMQFAQDVEERDGHYRSVLGTRKLAITGLEWKIEAASDSAQDKDVAAFVSKHLGKASFSAMLFDLLDGVSKGYSVVEIVWKMEEGRIIPAKYMWVDQKSLNFDEDTQTEIQLIDDDHPVYGAPLQFGKYITHVPKLKSGVTARSGLIFTVAAMFLMKSFITKDWMAFAEVFGMPIVHAESVGNLTEEEKDDVHKALRSFGSDATALFDQNVMVKFSGVNTTNHGNFFNQTLGYWNKEISKVTLGQTMSSEDGASLAQAKVHDGVRKDIRNADAKRLAESINELLITALVEFNFGVGTPLPIFSFETSEREDLVKLAGMVSTLAKAGLPIPESWAYAKFGIPQPKEGERVLIPQETPDPKEGDDDGGSE